MTTDRFPKRAMFNRDGQVTHYLPGHAIGFQQNDGGRRAAGYGASGNGTGDCVARAIAIAVFGAKPPWQGIDNVTAGEAYEKARALIIEHSKDERKTKRRPNKSQPSNGVRKSTTSRIMSELGWSWRATMAIGGGCTTHLRADELPGGTIIVRLSKHVCAVVDGVVHDTYCDDRDGTRYVYGYWYKPNE